MSDITNEPAPSSIISLNTFPFLSIKVLTFWRKKHLVIAHQFIQIHGLVLCMMLWHAKNYVSQEPWAFLIDRCRAERTFECKKL